MSLSGAKSRVSAAKDYLNSGRLDLVEQALAAGEKFLEAVPANEADPVRAELQALREQFAKMPTDQETRSISAARGKVRQARSQIADRQLMGVDDTIARAVKYLDGVRAEHLTEILKDVEAVKAEYAAALEKERGPAKPAAPGAPPPAAPAPAPTAAKPSSAVAPPKPAAAPATAAPSAAPALSDEEQANLSRARGLVGSARSLAESRRTDEAEGKLEQAAELLDKVPAAAAAALRAQADEIRGVIAQEKGAEIARRIEDEVRRQLSGADSQTRTGAFDSAAGHLDQALSRLAEADAQAGLSAELRASLEQRAHALRAALAAKVKQDALDRALPLLEELEQKVASDPFAGLDEHSLRRTANDLSYLRARIFGGLHRAPEADPDVVEVVKRVVAVDQKIDAFTTAWGKAVVDAQVSNSWAWVEKEIAGWEAERDEGAPAHLNEPELGKTRVAVQRTRVLLESEETKRLRAEHPGDPAVQGPFEKAERVLAAAGEKLRAAYHRVLDAADQLETPLSQFVLNRPGQMAFNAAQALEGTPHRDEVVARARALDARWKTEVAAIMKARQDLYDKLAAEAEVTWPKLRDAFSPRPFDANGVRPGTLVRLDGHYNRIGWDYGSKDFNFATLADGVVLAGVYAPHVLEALEHAWYELKLDVNDRIPWDLLLLVEGTGKVGLRTRVTLREKLTGAVLGEIEEWPPIDCLRVRVVGLHAGPVAVANDQ